MTPKQSRLATGQAGKHRNFPALSRTVPASSCVLTKRFIRNFYFPSPSWENLPVGFPNLSRDGLTYEETLLLDAIKLAYVNEVGRKTFTSKAGQALLIGLIILTAVGGQALLIRLISSPKGEFTKTVSAATLKVGEIVESTRSAILRK